MMMATRALIVAAVAALAACVSPATDDALGAARPSCAVRHGGGQPARRILCLVNAERAGHGRPALRMDVRLSQAARRHSADMVSHRYFAHVSPAGQNPTVRVARTGWLDGRRRWLVGETLAWGSGWHAAPDAIFRAWMQSPPHRRALLDPRFCFVGIGIVAGTPVAAAGRGATYTADLGSGRTGACA
jgi:uncharacterized protein YkwD